MKKLIPLLIFLCLSGLSKSQEPSRRYEFGATIITINSFNTKDFMSDRPAMEFINGVFFRYTKNRWALRVLSSYSENSSSYVSPSGTSEPGGKEINNKDFRIGAGAQFSILKRKDFFYSFVDLSYRNLFSTGYGYGGMWGGSEKFTNTSNGYDIFFGLGFKVSLVKNVYLSPDLGYYISTNFVEQRITDLHSGKEFNQNYTEVFTRPVIKLHLTVGF